MEEHLVPGPGLQQRTFSHHRDPIRDLGYDRQIVGDEKHAQAVALLQLFEQKQYLCLHGNVQGGGWLIGNQQ